MESTDSSCSTLHEPVSSGPALPPMLQHYRELKARFHDTFLFYQVGDFYELFFDDAVRVSKLLNLTLTSRDRNNPDPIPMCGIPVASVDGYLERLVQQGFSGAVVSQYETSDADKKGDSQKKGIIERRVERVVTPGIRLLSTVARDADDQFVLAVLPSGGGEFALAYCGVQRSVILAREGVAAEELRDEILRIGPAEVILPRSSGDQTVDGRLGWVRMISGMLGESRVKFRPETAGGEQGARGLSAVRGYSGLDPWGRRAVRLLMRYIDENLAGLKLPLFEITPERFEHHMVVEGTTRRNLELVRNLRDGGVDGTLYGYLRETQTAGGARLLRDWIGAPLLDRIAIERRLDAVAAFVSGFSEREELRVLLARVADLERVAARLELRVCNPRELGAVRDAVEAIPRIASILDRLSPSELLRELKERANVGPETSLTLTSALAESPPPVAGDGCVFRAGFDKELDEVVHLAKDGAAMLAEYEAEERQRTGIPTLKVRDNQVIGYYIEVTKSHLSKVPDDFKRRQSMVQAERFTTDRLARLERDIVGARDRLRTLERKLFEEFRESLVSSAPEVRAFAEALSELDCLSSFAEVAERERLVRPALEDSGALDIVGGKHPVLARRLGSECVPNSLGLGGAGASAAVITGPNMGGKSTFLRQTGLLVVMAQIGSFVPAESASIGIVDRLYARLGASDDMSEGDSTFMVEMREASQIITRATSRSLVLIDEIGRGTSTRDGLAIARAVLEWLTRRTNCRLLFATHFHELTGLAGEGSGMINLCVGSVEHPDGVLFTHRIEHGAAKRSYGIEVARLAHLPEELLGRASELLDRPAPREQPQAGQLALFGGPAAVEQPEVVESAPEGDPFEKFAHKKSVSESRWDPVLALVRGLEPDDLSPREALELAYRIRDLCDRIEKNQETNEKIAAAG